MVNKKIKTQKVLTTDEVMDKSKMYAKDSLDRFGDDLMEVLLSYLQLEDRFCHELVSKQWQRLIYETIDGIDINTNLLNKMMKTNIFGQKYIHFQNLSLILRKCANIQTIDCRKVGTNVKRVFETIVEMRDKCLNVRQIECNFDTIDDNLLQYLCQTFGPMFTQISCRKPSLRQCLSLCPKLTDLTIQGLDLVFNETTNHSLVKNLTKFEFIFDPQFTNEKFDTFMANNKSLKSVVISGIAPNIESQETVIGFTNRLSELQELQELKLYFDCNDYQLIKYSLSQPLTEISLKCLKLKVFCLSLKSQTPQLNAQTFESIKHVTIKTIEFMAYITRWRTSGD